MGRRKIEIKMVKDTNARQVTFSKRRTGLFKKANELSILCGAEVAIVVFSPGNKPFSFGHPDVDGVANRFLHLEPNENGAYGTSSSEIDKLDNLNQQLEHVMGEMLVEDKNGKEHEKALKKYKAPIEGFNSVHHQELNGSLAELKSVVELRVNEMEATAALLLLAEKYVDGKENHVAKNN